jgi:hypothetical protein
VEFLTTPWENKNLLKKSYLQQTELKLNLKKKMKKSIFLFVAVILFLDWGCKGNHQGVSKRDNTGVESVTTKMSNTDNILTSRETSDGWKLLFDGKTPAGWINAKTGSFPPNGWEIKDGVLSTNPATKLPDGGGDIVTTGKFRNFELNVDFMYKQGGNSGIKYFVDTEINNGALASIGCEYQILDDRNNPDANEGIAGNRKLAGLYDLIAPNNIKDNGVDQWNKATIVVNGSKVQHWLNGFLTVEYERATPKWKELVATSKFKLIPGFGEAEEGRLLLQDHGDTVSFKNIKIREF